MSENIPNTDTSNINNRMSRIITKLFTRLIKAEEREALPFCGDRLDIEALLCVLEDKLVECDSLRSQKYDTSDISYKLKPSTSMGRMLIMHLLKAKSSQGQSGKLKLMIDESNLINVETLFKSCCLELGLDVSLNVKNQTKKMLDNDINDELSALIFAIGGASEDVERKKALNKLRDFVAQHEKVIDLECHLSSLSGPFQSYILDQLRLPLELNNGLGICEESSIDNDDNTKVSMSDKLRALKSKISAAEKTAQSIIVPEAKEINYYNSDLSISSKGTHTTTDQDLSSISKKGTNVLSLRERLAGLNQKSSIKNVKTSQRFEAGSGAAALRARLQSVRSANQKL